MISLVRSLTFYLVSWLCLSGFLLPFALVQAKGHGTAIKAPATIIASGHPCYPPVGSFCTYNQQQYGDASSPVNSILTTYFPVLFPNGIAIGADVFLNVDNLLTSVLNLVGGLLDSVLGLVFYTVDDIVSYLPQVGRIVGPLTEGSLPADAPVNPLAGNALALALNIALDANVAVFSRTNACNLTDLYVVAGPCAGLSVSAVLNIANQILGNTIPAPLLGVAPLAIAANINLCVANINNNFLAASAANNFLALPGLNLQAIVNLCLGLPAITADVGATLVLKGLSVGALLNVQVNVGAKVTTFKAWRTAPNTISANSPVPLEGLLLPLPSVVGGLLDDVVSLVGGVVDVVLDDTLCLVNYLLNNKPLSARLIDIQAAIFLLLNPHLNVYALLNLGIPCNPQLVLAILADVKLNGVGFLPAPGQLVGVFANVQLAGGIKAKVLLELNLPILGLDVNANLCIAL